MSALGAAPGYVYPRLDYGNAEYLEINVVGANIAAPTQYISNIAVAHDGFAYLVQSVSALIFPSAVVANRLGQVSIFSPDGNTLSLFASTLFAVASVPTRWFWQTQLATAYSAGTDGYSPLQPIILPPGYGVNLVVNSAQAGDVIATTTVTGLRIPTLGNETPANTFAPTPLLL